MNDALRDLYTIPEQILPRNEKLIALVEECTRAEHCMRQIMQTLPPEQMQRVAEYISLRDALELQAVRQAIKFGKSCQR